MEYSPSGKEGHARGADIFEHFVAKQTKLVAAI